MCMAACGAAITSLYPVGGRCKHHACTSEWRLILQPPNGAWLELVPTCWASRCRQHFRNGNCAQRGFAKPVCCLLKRIIYHLYQVCALRQAAHCQTFLCVADRMPAWLLSACCVLCMLCTRSNPCRLFWKHTALKLRTLMSRCSRRRAAHRVGICRHTAAVSRQRD